MLLNKFQAIIHVQKPSSVIALFGPFDQGIWALGFACFTACCLLLAIRTNRRFAHSLFDTVYALPLLQRDQKHHWQTKHSKILLLHYCFCSRVVISLYSAMIIKLLMQTRSQVFSHSRVLNALESGRYRLLVTNDGNIHRILKHRTSIHFNSLRNAVQHHPPVVTNEHFYCVPSRVWTVPSLCS